VERSPTLFGGFNNGPAASGAESALGFPRCRRLRSFESRPAFSLCGSDPSPCGCAKGAPAGTCGLVNRRHRPGASPSANPELGADLRDSGFYLRFLFFIADQSHCKKVSSYSRTNCHTVKSPRRILVSNSWYLQNAPSILSLFARTQLSRRAETWRRAPANFCPKLFVVYCFRSGHRDFN